MSNSSARHVDDRVSNNGDALIPTSSMRAGATPSRKFSEWPLIRPFSYVVRGILDTVNCSLDAVRGRYDR